METFALKFTCTSDNLPQKTLASNGQVYQLKLAARSGLILRRVRADPRGMTNQGSY